MATIDRTSITTAFRARWPRAAVFTVVAVATSIGIGCGEQQGSATNPAGQGVVERVVDGDTIAITINDHVHLVRLLGIDAPETVHPTKPEQCYGLEASDGLNSVLPVGSVVGLTRDIEATDHFDRLLLYVHRDDGLFINLWLIQEGLADSLFYEPNTHHKVAFTRAVNQAKTNSVGLWGACEGPDQPLP